MDADLPWIVWSIFQINLLKICSFTQEEFNNIIIVIVVIIVIIHIVPYVILFKWQFMK